MITIPGGEKAVKRVGRFVHGLAEEIARRCTIDERLSLTTEHSELIQQHAQMVLVEWLLGQYVPDITTE